MPLEAATRIGRQVASSRDFSCNGVRPRAFTNRNHRDISVDRLGVILLEQSIDIARKINEARTPKRTFYGWAVLTVEQIEGLDGEVQLAPRTENPEHCNIIPPTELTDSDELKSFDQNLADIADWQGVPTSP